MMVKVRVVWELTDKERSYDERRRLGEVLAVDKVIKLANHER